MIKNVVILNDSVDIDGGATQVALDDFYSLLTKVDVTFIYCFPSTSSEEVSSPNFINLDFPKLDPGLGRPAQIVTGIYNFQVARRLQKELSRFSGKDTIVHIHNFTRGFSPAIFNVLRKCKLPFVITAHDYFLVCPNGGYFDFRRQAICGLTPLGAACIFCNCDKRNMFHKIWRTLRSLNLAIFLKLLNGHFGVLFVSNFSKQIIESRLPSAKTNVILNRVPPKSVGLRVLSASSPFIYIGRITAEKGVRRMIEVFDRAGAPLTVIGDGDELATLKIEYPRVTFKGWMTKAHIEQILPNARALVFPSVWPEVYGLTVMEAAAYALPAIVSKHSGVAENFVSEESCLTYDPNLDGELQACLLRFLDDDFCLSVGSKAQRVYRLLESTQAARADELLEMYEEVHTVYEHQSNSKDRNLS